MKIHHLRSATFIIESADTVILIDPMLGAKGSIPPFALLRFKAQRNPLLDLPAVADGLLDKVTHCLLTHSQTFGIQALQHTDHLDAAGEQLLRSRQIPVVTASKDSDYLQNKGLRISHGLQAWQSIDFAGGKLTAVPAQHGHGWIHKLMANGIGFILQLPGEPSIYISGDTVLTADVERALSEFKPELAVLAAGQAQMDVGQPLLMAKQELLRFVQLAPGRVIANHMEALNHCPITRPVLRKLLREHGLKERVLIPEDGESLQL